MPTEEQAAVCIQSRFRGFRWRREQHRQIRAVTKLQALQRGRFTRREFAELRSFSRQQDNFQQATRRRQIRIWRNEQEFYFLQHTNAADLERVRDFQQQHSARLIQRAWRGVSAATAASKGDTIDVANPSDRIYTFDPFGFATADPNSKTARFDQWSRDERIIDFTQRAPSLLLGKEDLQTSWVHQLPAAIADESAFTSRRKAIQDRIKRLAAEKKSKTESPSKPPHTQANSSLAKGAKTPTNRRRELYDQLIIMQRTTAKRILQYNRESRAVRAEKEASTAQLVASCKNRLEHLLSESPEQLSEDNQSFHDETEELVGKWDSARRVQAWNHHRRAVRSVLDKRHWWQTHLAGSECDIRRMVVTKSRWEDERKIWVWPCSGGNNQKHVGDDTNVDTAPVSDAPTSYSPEIYRFLVSDKGTKGSQDQLPDAVDEQEASDWWRAHCTQSHLAINGGLVVNSPYSAEFSNNVNADGNALPVCTTEVVANRELYELQQHAKSAARSKSLKSDVEQRMKALSVQVQYRVHDMEAQVEANTQLILEHRRRKEEHRIRITREQQAVVNIQRHARGMLGRRAAREQRAEFFVMVRGRAIRRGKCEECGDKRAVLECQQCEESLHFCPNCWVHVHSTRRRKTHVAIPMTAVVTREPLRNQDKVAKAPLVARSAAGPCQTKVVSVEISGSPQLRSLPSPSHHASMSKNFASAKMNARMPAVKKPSMTPLKQDDVRVATPSIEIDAPENMSSDLAEACALARRVRYEVAEAPMATQRPTRAKASTEKCTPARYTARQAIQEATRDDEEHFSTVDEDGAAINDDGMEEVQEHAGVESATTVANVDTKPQLAPESERKQTLPLDPPAPLSAPSTNASAIEPNLRDLIQVAADECCPSDNNAGGAQAFAESSEIPVEDVNSSAMADACQTTVPTNEAAEAGRVPHSGALVQEAQTTEDVQNTGPELVDAAVVRDDSLLSAEENLAPGN